MTPSIPQPLKAEHDDLHEALVRAIRAGGRTGEAARAVAGALHPHFLKEEEYALPPLGLLARVARGEDVSGAAEAAIAMAAELPDMLGEHGRIVATLGALVEAARAEGHPEHVRFAEELILHARTEEEVLYPATILLGEYLKLGGKPRGRA